MGETRRLRVSHQKRRATYVAPETTHRCRECNKLAHSSRSAAKGMIKKHHRGEHVSVYQCPNPHNGVPSFHIGHLSQVVISGSTTRATLYRR